MKNSTQARGRCLNPQTPNLNAILALLTGSLFADIEAKAAFWQRPRRLPPPRHAIADLPLVDGTSDVGPMIEAFRLAYLNLQEIWSLVLPPATLLGLKRLSVVDATSFRMPESLWARIVFDFLIAYRLRTINRGHLLGALTPLYLAWRQATSTPRPRAAPSATLKPLPQHSRRINNTWSRVGVGRTGSTHDFNFNNQRVRKLSGNTQEFQGVSPMHNILVVMLQTIRDDASQPTNADNGAIWHHMSDALHQSLYRVLSLLIAILPGILAFFVALAVFTLIGMAISALLRRGPRLGQV